MLLAFSFEIQIFAVMQGIIFLGACLLSVDVLETTLFGLCRFASIRFKPAWINIHIQSRALIRWKLIAVNSLNQMLKGFEPLEETAMVLKEVRS